MIGLYTFSQEVSGDVLLSSIRFDLIGSAEAHQLNPIQSLKEKATMAYSSLMDGLNPDYKQ